MFLDTTGKYMTDFYIVPWCRFQPYIIGIVLGFALYKMKDKKVLDINPIMSLWIWVGHTTNLITFNKHHYHQVMAFIVGCAVIYGIIPHLDVVSDPITNSIPLADRVAYNGLHR